MLSDEARRREVEEKWLRIGLDPAKEWPRLQRMARAFMEERPEP